MKGEACIRRKIVLDEENFYLLIGKNFVLATTPFENRPENEKLRRIVDAICHEVTEAQGGGEEDEHIQA
jgi:hypothetical protein